MTRVAAAQFAPVYMDLERSLEKAVSLISQARADGIDAPADAIDIRPYERHEIDQDKCTRCGTCASGCPADAVKVE